MLNKLWDLEQYSYDDMEIAPIKVYCCPAALDDVK